MDLLLSADDPLFVGVIDLCTAFDFQIARHERTGLAAGLADSDAQAAVGLQLKLPRLGLIGVLLAGLAGCAITQSKRRGSIG